MRRPPATQDRAAGGRGWRVRDGARDALMDTANT